MVARSEQQQAIVVINPGRWGMNYQAIASPVNPAWSAAADNCVVDNGELRGRFGLLQLSTSTSAGENLVRCFYGRGASNIMVASSATALYSYASGSFTDRTGSLTFTTGYWKFQDFDDGFFYAVQAGETMIRGTGSADFADVTATAGTLPDGDHLLNAFGRLWGTNAAEDTVIFSALGDYRDYSTASGGGSLDLSNVWTGGRDYITGLAQLGPALVVFGRRHIVIYTDGSGSSTGVNPDDLYVSEVLEGIGCVARDSIVNIDGDVLFMSERGLERLSRVIRAGGAQHDTVSWQIDPTLQHRLTHPTTGIGSLGWGESVRSVACCAWPRRRYFLAFFDDGTSDENHILVHFLGERTQDETGRALVPITQWVTHDTTDNTSFLYDSTHGCPTLEGELWVLDKTDVYQYEDERLIDLQDAADDEAIEVWFTMPPMSFAEAPAQQHALKTIVLAVTQSNARTGAVVASGSWGDATADVGPHGTGAPTKSVTLSGARIQFPFDVSDNAEGTLFRTGFLFEQSGSNFGGGGIRFKKLKLVGTPLNLGTHA